ncbi:polysaccharide deacetylase family protein [Halobacteriovorax sp. HLS]|uniref:polysaccharide deacetylase family protein n=1 Tax=Halobacteriovorax sp. HLS TaxID=2234000 RepID=UPI000FD795CD|nr:polysaccharide deacetylase family protein [Halobacteriovorax sp. HLS]
MKPLITLCTILLSAQVHSVNLKQFPNEQQVYRPNVDVGFDQYRTKSLKGSNKVALTYDDGPHETRTPKLLDLLKSENVKATFFVLTQNITDKTLPIIERILDEGHILASHDHDHENNNHEEESEFKEELYKSVLLLEQLKAKYGSSQISSYYRFPYGAYGSNKFYHHFNTMKEVSNELYGENCINFAFWDIDTSDWVPTITAQQISDNIMAHVKGGTAYKHKVKRTIFGNTKYKMVKYKIKYPFGGGVALMHDIHERSIEASEIFIRDAKKNGISIVPLNEIKEFSYANKSCILK